MGNILNDVLGVSSSAKSAYRYNMNLQHDAQAFNAAEAQKERDWQTQMSNTEHQRAVADLQAAGLNPVLAAGGGNSSSAGAVASSSGGGGVGTPTASTDPVTMASAVVGMLNSSKMTNAEVGKADAEVDRIDAEIEKINAEIANLNANTGKINYDTNLDKGNNINSNTPYPIKILNSAKASAKREIEDWKEKGKQSGWTGWKHRMRTRILRQ